MRSERCEFVSQQCRCDALFFVPHGWCRPARLPTIVIAPGGAGLIGAPKEGGCGYGLVELGKRLAEAGFAVLAYDGRGQGISGGVRTGQNQYVEDLNAALGYLQSRDEVDCRRVGIFGHSAGGIAAVSCATSADDVRSIVLWATLPRYSTAKSESDGRLARLVKHMWEQGTKEQDYEEFLKQYVVIDPIETIGRLRKPVLLIGGSADKLLFREVEQRELLEAASASPTAAFVSIRGEGHWVRHTSECFPVICGMITSWFKSTV